MIQGKVAEQSIKFLSIPKGKSGEVEIETAEGLKENVAWSRDEQGIWIETSRGMVGFDYRLLSDEGGLREYELHGRKSAIVIGSATFLKNGEGMVGGQSKAKKGIKVKSQMPGKIIKVTVKAGDSVSKGDALLTMEAMKMESEIKSPQDGVIKTVKVVEGQAIETGAELLSFE